MARAFFPVIVVVFVIRSFWVEPFKIPSGSMKPTLARGRLHLVNKYVYGIRLPVVNMKVVEVDPIKARRRGRVPLPADRAWTTSSAWSARPGTRCSIAASAHDSTAGGGGAGNGYTPTGANYLRLAHLQREAGRAHHQMMIVPAQPPVDLAQVRQFAHRSNCEYNDDGFSCLVPAGHYFMMGDNRDQSSDSRYWGFVPDDHIKGRAFLVWMNFNDFKRIGNGIE
jgi:signal peptidase I